MKNNHLSDRILLHFTKLVNDRISNQQMRFIYCEIELVDKKKVIRIDIEPALMPAFIKEENEEKFYIRTGPSTIPLSVSEVLNYIKTRFNNSLW